ncbi:MAG: cytochrome c1 [Gammaproteobacteria bacterium MedPE]|nr:MAG: cytochrome c1 [Gammaproteobacteria bacterium MedPE]
MKKLIIALVALIPTLGMAAGGGAPTMKAPIDLTDKASLQNGAKLFMNYCFGCHDTRYQRYNRVARDIGITDQQMVDNLIFTGVKVGNLMYNSVDDEQGAKWFGQTPPDLTMITRVKGVDFVYTYLKSFYADPERPFGVNNSVFKDVGMPHVLQSLQGVPTAEFTTDADGNRVLVKDEHGLAVITTDGSGEMSDDEYDIAVRDITNFLTYASEPSKLERQNTGKWVLGFLAIFFIISYLLKKEYWRDVH